MVVRIIGEVSGHEIVFMPIDDAWVAQIPPVPSGVYVVSLNAFDDAGNSSYFAKAIFTVDVENLIYEIKFVDFSGELKMQNPIFNISVADYSCDENSKYFHDESMVEYDVAIV